MILPIKSFTRVTFVRVIHIWKYTKFIKVENLKLLAAWEFANLKLLVHNDQNTWWICKCFMNKYWEQWCHQWKWFVEVAIFLNGWNEGCNPIVIHCTDRKLPDSPANLDPAYEVNKELMEVDNVSMFPVVMEPPQGIHLLLNMTTRAPPEHDQAVCCPVSQSWALDHNGRVCIT